MSSFKLTFNRPAVQSFFEGEDARGLKVSIEEEAVVFLPVSNIRESDVIPLSERTRGGAEAMVEGRMAKQLAMALDNPHGPFFILKRQKGGAVAAVPYASSSSPSKFAPHMRTWFGKSNETAAPAVMPSLADFPQFLDAVRGAKRIVDESSKNRRAGRPSKEVSDAKALLSQFRELSEEIGPVVEKDESLLRQAHELLGSIIGEVPPSRPKGRKKATRKAPTRSRRVESHMAAA